jgi:hypothetical protein
METEMRELVGAVLGLTITVLGFVSSNDVRAQDPPKLLPHDRTLMPFASPQGAF